MGCAAAPVPQHLLAAPWVFPAVHLCLSFLASSPFQLRCSFLCRIMQVIKCKEMNECAEDIKQCPKEFQSQSSACAVFRLQKLQQGNFFFHPVLQQPFLNLIKVRLQGEGEQKRSNSSAQPTFCCQQQKSGQPCLA